jgi:4-alpha-glucanotransferase
MPNIVNPDNLQYAGIDGTWWFVRAAWKYYLATGDREFLIEAWPRVRLAIDGALEKAVDHRGFLTHGDGETWMDAGGEHNPYSPRGDRAVELQALFHHGLLAGSMWDEALTEAGVESGGHAGGWRAKAAMLAQSFRASFWFEERNYLHDHLNMDGSADIQIRPNALLALWVYLDTIEMLRLTDSFRQGEMPEYAELVTWVQFREIVSTAMETVILPHGVTSLDTADPDFKPLHLDLDNYYYDAAYHNGDVWVWLAGPAVTCMIAAGEERAARELFTPMITEILDEGCAGSLREIRDGTYIQGKEEFGGAASQAWSLAEFIRVYDETSSEN